MIVATYDTYPYTVSIKLHTWEEWDEICTWAKINDIPAQMSFGKVWFEKEEHAILFKLKFGLWNN